MKVLPVDQRSSLEDLMEHIALEIVPFYRKAQKECQPVPTKLTERLELSTIIQEIVNYVKEKSLAEVQF